MAIYISPVGLAAAPTANTLNVLATIKENLCYRFSVNATNQPQVVVAYQTGTPTLVETTVFVPITAQVTITTPSNKCGCNPHVQTFTERFVVAFQGQTAVPTAVTINNVGTDRFPSCINACGVASGYTINDSLEITITPAAAAAASVRVATTNAKA